MKRYKPLFENRSHPEQNPHIGAWDYVEKYKDNPDVYISFTEIDKIGINPQSKYNTPVGIYTYPLKEFMELNEESDDIEKLKSLGYTVGKLAPYAGNAKYINFIKIKPSAKATFIDDMYKDYGSDKYDRDIKILTDKYKHLSFNKITSEDIDSFLVRLKKAVSSVKNDDDLFKKVTKEVLLSRLFAERKNGVFEDATGKITDIISANKRIFNNEVEKNIKDFINYKNKLIVDIIEQGIENAKVSNSVMMMWNITRLLAEKLSDNAKQASTKWNLILSKDLGYSGFADKSGKGYIHTAEPMQAVFFGTFAFEIITREENKPARKEVDGRYKDIRIAK